MCLQIMHPDSHYSPPSLPPTLTLKPYVIMFPLIIWILSKHPPCFHGLSLSVCSPHSSLSSSLEEGSQTTPGPLAAHLTHRKLPARANKYCATLYPLPVWSEMPLFSLSYTPLQPHWPPCSMRHQSHFPHTHILAISSAWNTLPSDLCSWLPPLPPRSWFKYHTGKITLTKAHLSPFSTAPFSI